jgi:hypothetical protein
MCHFKNSLIVDLDSKRLNIKVKVKNMCCNCLQNPTLLWNFLNVYIYGSAIWLEIRIMGI